MEKLIELWTWANENGGALGATIGALTLIVTVLLALGTLISFIMKKMKGTKAPLDQEEPKSRVNVSVTNTKVKGDLKISNIGNHRND